MEILHAKSKIIPEKSRKKRLEYALTASLWERGRFGYETVVNSGTEQVIQKLWKLDSFGMDSQFLFR